MRTICIMNHKGGVAKTTTAINLAAGLSRHGKKVLLIDLDPQGNIDLSLRVKATYNLYDSMTAKVPLEKCIVNLATNFDIISSTETLVKAEYYLYNQEKSRTLLRDILRTIKGYDFVLIDCPPSLGILNQNVLAYCEEVFVPTSADFLGFDALQKMVTIVQKVNEAYKAKARISLVIPTMYDQRSNMSKETLAQIRSQFPTITSTPIRMNAKVKEAPKYGKSIFAHAKSSPGGKDYAQLVDEVLTMSKDDWIKPIYIDPEDEDE